MGQSERPASKVYQTRCSHLIYARTLFKAASQSRLTINDSAASELHTSLQMRVRSVIVNLLCAPFHSFIEFHLVCQSIQLDSQWSTNNHRNPKPCPPCPCRFRSREISTERWYIAIVCDMMWTCNKNCWHCRSTQLLKHPYTCHLLASQMTCEDEEQTCEKDRLWCAWYHSMIAPHHNLSPMFPIWFGPHSWHTWGHPEVQ